MRPYRKRDIGTSSATNRRGYMREYMRQWNKEHPGVHAAAELARRKKIKLDKENPNMAIHHMTVNALRKRWQAGETAEDAALALKLSPATGRKYFDLFLSGKSTTEAHVGKLHKNGTCALGAKDAIEAVSEILSDDNYTKTQKSLFIAKLYGAVEEFELEQKDDEN